MVILHPPPVSVVLFSEVDLTISLSSPLPPSPTALLQFTAFRNSPPPASTPGLYSCCQPHLPIGLPPPLPPWVGACDHAVVCSVICFCALLNLNVLHPCALPCILLRANACAVVNICLMCLVPMQGCRIGSNEDGKLCNKGSS